MAFARLFDGDDGAFSTAALLTPAEAVRHALDLTNEDLLELGDEAFFAVARVRRIVCRPMQRANWQRVARIH